MLEDIEVLYHSSIRINKKKIIYIDPFKINQNYNDADIIFITHDHYDHFSEDDIKKVMNSNTKIVVTKDLLKKAMQLGFENSKILAVEPNETKNIDNIKFTTTPAYNINKQFHKKENNWVGYIIEINSIKYYITGDTDITPESKNVKCDVIFVPVGGTYTMTFEEAANLVNTINPKVAVPIHYGSIVGTKKDAEDFIKLLKPEIKGVILMK